MSIKIYSAVMPLEISGRYSFENERERISHGASADGLIFTLLLVGIWISLKTGP